MSDERSPVGAEARQLPARFYKAVTVERGDCGYRVLLDERVIKTPQGQTVEIASEHLAEQLQAEWSAQETHIDPATMPLTRLVNTALDGIQGREGVIASALAEYAGSDALCYRADHPAELAALQNKAWDPMIKWAADDLGVVLEPTQGVMPVAQPASSMQRVEDILGGFDALSLCALHVLTTLTGSLVLALALWRGRMSADDVWAAAHVDEDYQITQWGEDSEAKKRRAARREEFDAADRLLQLVR